MDGKRSMSVLMERARVILAASVGDLTVKEAVEILGISRQRYYEIEERAMGAFLNALEPRPAGRPAKEPDPRAPLLEKIEELEKENSKLWLYVKVLRHMAGIGGDEKKTSDDPPGGSTPRKRGK